MKIFISQPMRGLTRDQIISERKHLSSILIETFDNIEIINSIIDQINENIQNKDLLYLAKSIELLANADMIIMAPNWRKSRGCIIEHDCALSYKIPIMYLKEKDDNI